LSIDLDLQELVVRKGLFVAIQRYFRLGFWLRAVAYVLRRVWGGVIAALVFVFSAAIKCVPSSARLQIRNKAALVRKMDYPRTPIYISIDSWIEDELRSREVEKEPGTVDWIEGWLKAGDVLYDIGANVGSYSLITFGFLKGEAQIFSFEPGFLSFAQLCKNINLNKASSAISPFQIALSDETSLIDLNYQNLETGGALHALGDPIDSKGERFEPVFALPTLSYRLDDFVAQFGLPKPNHIKMDVDGLEFSILKGGENTLNHAGLQSVLLEIEGNEDSDRFDAWFDGIGMTLHSRRDYNSLYVRKIE
jgi:FkbM family methyltransferase